MRVDREARNRLKQSTTAVKTFSPSRRCIGTQPSFRTGDKPIIYVKNTIYEEKKGLILKATRFLSSKPETKKSAFT